MDWNQMDNREGALYVSGFMEAPEGVTRQEEVEGFLGLGVPVSDEV